MESNPISHRLSQAWVRPTREAAERHPERRRSPNEETREGPRKTKRDRDGVEVPAETKAASADTAAADSNESAAKETTEPRTEVDDLDARGRRLDLRV